MDNASKRNQFEKMSLCDLKEYLKAQGVSVTGYLKPALVEIAKSVQKMMLPVLDYKKSKEEGKKKSFLALKSKIHYLQRTNM